MVSQNIRRQKLDYLKHMVYATKKDTINETPKRWPPETWAQRPANRSPIRRVSRAASEAVSNADLRPWRPKRGEPQAHNSLGLSRAKAKTGSFLMLLLVDKGKSAKGNCFFRALEDQGGSVAQIDVPKGPPWYMGPHPYLCNTGSIKVHK